MQIQLRQGKRAWQSLLAFLTISRSWLRKWRTSSTGTTTSTSCDGVISTLRSVITGICTTTTTFKHHYHDNHYHQHVLHNHYTAVLDNHLRHYDTTTITTSTCVISTNANTTSTRCATTVTQRMQLMVQVTPTVSSFRVLDASGCTSGLIVGEATWNFCPAASLLCHEARPHC